MKSKTGLILLFALCFGITYGQANTIRPLKIGDKVPNVTLARIVNFRLNQAKTNDFKGKLIILDFWSKDCKGCVASMPEMEELQNYFGDKIQIFLVNYYSSWHSLKNPEFPKKERSLIIRNTKLPFVFNSKSLNTLFPHLGEPYHIWIDKNGKIIAMTDGQNTTKKHIQMALDEENISLSVATPTANNTYKSIFCDSTTQSTLKYYSAIGGYMPGESFNVNELLFGSSKKEVIGFKRLNVTIPYLFRCAFDVDPDKVLLELSNPDNYFEPEDPNRIDEWRKNNLYSYEVKAPIDKALKLMQYDLTLNFNIHASLEVRKMKVWIVHRTSKEDLLFTKDPSTDLFVEHTKDYYRFQNAPFTRFLDYLKSENIKKNRSKALPIMDETGFNLTYMIDMEIHCPLYDFDTLNKQLLKYGITIVLEEKNLQVLVLKESK